MTNDTIELNGRTYAVRVEFDDAMGAPWEEQDGHGIVSDWTTRDKRAGELILATDRQAHRFYDVPATLDKASAEGWGLGDEQHATLTAKLGRAPTAREVKEEAVRLDYEYLRAWCNDEWHWVYIVVTAPDGEFDTLGGVASNDTDYIAECTQEMAAQLEDAYQDRQTEEATI